MQYSIIQLLIVINIFFRKLKNRVAAQTSRDRKKAKMDDMEYTIKNLTDENAILRDRCNDLKTENIDLKNRTGELERQVMDLTKRFDEQCAELLKLSNVKNISCTGTNNLNTGSAVSYDPLQKGLLTPSTILQTNDNNNNIQKNMKKTIIGKKQQQNESIAALWRIIALCLLYRTCSKISMQQDWKNLPKAYSQMSPQIWKMILQNAANHLPKLKAPQSECLNQWWGPQQKTWNPPSQITMEVEI